jgi:hypothetical protein
MIGWRHGKVAQELASGEVVELPLAALAASGAASEGLFGN